MTNAQSIEQQINRDFQKFYEDEYKGSVPIPEDIVELFKRGVVSLPAQAHMIHATKLKVLGNKKISEITNGDLTEMIKLIQNTPPEKLYFEVDFNSIVDKQIQFQKFLLAYNTYIQKFEEGLKEKQANLTLLSSKNSNGNMRIIN